MIEETKKCPSCGKSMPAHNFYCCLKCYKIANEGTKDVHTSSRSEGQ
jgi:predicted nucleic acid-binding Zn ribbon protein